MGKRLLSSFIILYSIFIIHNSYFNPSPVFAISDQIHVTASVLPSPEWLTLVQNHSSVTSSATHFIIQLSDGNHPIKNQTVTYSDLTTTTNIYGHAYFVKKNSVLSPKFSYEIMGQSVNIPYLGIAELVATWTEVGTAAALPSNLVCCLVMSTNPGSINPINPNTKTPPTGTSFSFFPTSQFLAALNFNFGSTGGGGIGSVGSP